MDKNLSLLSSIKAVLWVLVGLYLINIFYPLIERITIINSVEPRTISARGKLAESELSTINIFNHTSPSVVYISTSKLVRGFWSRDVRKVPRGTGSGLIWDEYGHIITNYHVIKGASEANIRLNDGRTYPASLVGASQNHDLAVLKIDARFDLPPAVPIGSSEDLQVGQSVFAIGNPFGLDYTLTSGIVSALNRSLSAEHDMIINNLIQTDAAINPGNSGGPLLDSAGRLIGINTAIYSPSGAYAGIGFAVPVDTVNKVVPQLITFGKYTRPSLGITMDADLNKQIMQQLGIEGVAILDISPDSNPDKALLKPARVERYGITLGDVIQTINSSAVTSVKSLKNELDKYKQGDVVNLGVLRDQTIIEIRVTLE